MKGERTETLGEATPRDTVLPRSELIRRPQMFPLPHTPPVPVNPQDRNRELKAVMMYQVQTLSVEQWMWMEPPRAESESRALEANEASGTFRGNNIKHKRVLARLVHVFTQRTYLPNYPFKIKTLFLETYKAYSKVGGRCKGFPHTPAPTPHVQLPPL